MDCTAQWHGTTQWHGSTPLSAVVVLFVQGSGSSEWKEVSTDPVTVCLGGSQPCATTSVPALANPCLG